MQLSDIAAENVVNDILSGIQKNGVPGGALFEYNVYSAPPRTAEFRFALNRPEPFSMLICLDKDRRVTNVQITCAGMLVYNSRTEHHSVIVQARYEALVALAAVFKESRIRASIDSAFAAVRAPKEKRDE